MKTKLPKKPKGLFVKKVKPYRAEEVLPAMERMRQLQAVGREKDDQHSKEMTALRNEVRAIGERVHATTGVSVYVGI